MELDSTIGTLFALIIGFTLAFLFFNNPQTTEDSDTNRTVVGIKEEIEPIKKIEGKTFNELKETNQKIICDIKNLSKVYLWGEQVRIEKVDEECGTYTTIHKNGKVYNNCEKNELQFNCDWVVLDPEEIDPLYANSDPYNLGVKEDINQVPVDWLECVEQEFDSNFFSTKGKICEVSEVYR